ncbi:MAG: biotin/lipoate A/B protein ligase family protein [Limisphaerales bacterium]
MQSGPGNPAWNMALDEALLELAATHAKPVLRFYSWTEPAASFGYSQHYSEIEKVTHLRPLVRRPTGGGLVPHDADWTYSLVVPPHHWWYELPATESYRLVHEWLRDAFAKMNVVTEVAPCCRKEVPGQCFLGWEKYDLLWFGGKIAGAAQRRNKYGLLIQGSVQPPPVSLPRIDWQTAMCDVASDQWKVSWVELDFAANGILRDRAITLQNEKFSLESFNRRR